MAKTNWNKTLDEVLKHKTQQVVMTSEKTGNEYTTDVIPTLTVLSTGSIEVSDGKFKYSIVDAKNELEYIIKTSNLVDVKFGTTLQFKNVRGGATANGIGWYTTESVTIVQQN